MSTKRKRDNRSKQRTKGSKSITAVKGSPKMVVPVENRFSALTSHNDDMHSDYSVNKNDKQENFRGLHESNNSKDINYDNEIVGVSNGSPDSNESDGVVIESDASDNENEVAHNSEQTDTLPSLKKQKVSPNEIIKNQDFIELGMSSSEDSDVDQEENSDDGVISNDGLGSTEVEVSKSSYPWIKNHDHSKQREIADWLTLEINDFVNYISPSGDEIRARNEVVGKLKKEIGIFWKDAEAHVFGSSATDLYLPGSDIDMVVISQSGTLEERSKLYQLSSHLRNRNLAKQIEVIAKAKVPIIKFIDPATGIHVDVSFERSNGIHAAKKIRKWLSETPGLRELVLTVKQFLRSRKLNNVHVGGLGGYSTIILCYHFLRLHPRLASNNIKIKDNLGTLLIEFFELYGRNFSYDNLIIALDPDTDLPKYLLKKNFPELNVSKNPFTIIIQDPSDPYNNISRSSYNLRDLKKAFGGAYLLLVEKCFQLNAAQYKDRLGKSILGDIIKYKGKERDFNDDRDKVLNHALIDHAGNLTPEEEHDGLPHNEEDASLYSEVTVDSDVSVGYNKESSNDSGTNGKNVADYLDVNSSDSDTAFIEEKKITEKADDEEIGKPQLNREVKRRYWRQKGLEL